MRDDILKYTLSPYSPQQLIFDKKNKIKIFKFHYINELELYQNPQRKKNRKIHHQRWDIFLSSNYLYVFFSFFIFTVFFDENQYFFIILWFYLCTFLAFFYSNSSRCLLKLIFLTIRFLTDLLDVVDFFNSNFPTFMASSPDILVRGARLGDGVVLLLDKNHCWDFEF